MRWGHTVIKKFLLNWGLRKSEAEVDSFLTIFTVLGASEIGKVVGMAAVIHCQYTEKDPEFERLLNSRKGENRGPISVRILELNGLVNDMNRARRLEDAASMKLWNITFRCMTHDTLHDRGIVLWQTAAKGFPEAKRWLKDRLAHAESSGHQRDAPNLKKALPLYNYIPPQFRDDQR